MVHVANPSCSSKPADTEGELRTGTSLYKICGHVSPQWVYFLDVLLGFWVMDFAIFDVNWI